MKEIRGQFRVLAAEALGTFVLVFAGTGAIVADDSSGGQIGVLGTSVVFGIAVLLMICAIGRISGAHINPAVSLAFVLTGGLRLARLPGYLAAQFLGAIAASALLLLLFGNVANLGSTIPQGDPWQSVGMEVVFTALLVFVIMTSIADDWEIGVPAPVAIGSTVALASVILGPVSGGSLNPARSLAPALVSGTWEHQWVYVVAPAGGALIGTVIHQLLRQPGASIKAMTSLPDVSGDGPVPSRAESPLIRSS